MYKHVSYILGYLLSDTNQTSNASKQGLICYSHVSDKETYISHDKKVFLIYALGYMRFVIE
jgi:hypothetical protein